MLSKYGQKTTELESLIADMMLKIIRLFLYSNSFYFDELLTFFAGVSVTFLRSDCRKPACYCAAFVLVAIYFIFYFCFFYFCLDGVLGMFYTPVLIRASAGDVLFDDCLF